MKAGQRIAGAVAESSIVVGGRADAGLVLICDHASNAIPPEYGALGLPPAELQRHIAYDIGAEAITRRLARALDVPAVLSRHSRLLIDPNRGEDDPTLIMRLSDGAPIPGNKVLPPAERLARVERFWRPYHEAVGRTIASCLASGLPPAVFSIHSMTDAWKGVRRPWHVAILSEHERGFPDHLLAGFRARSDLIVGDNEPYVGGLEGSSLARHAVGRGLACATIEYRQDLVGDEAGQVRWADLTTPILQQWMERARLRGT